MNSKNKELNRPHMTDIAHSIDLNLSQKLQDRPYRRRFFWAESSARIAKQLIALRKLRNLNQKQLAEITGTKQPAISRAEQADYQNWNLNTLRSIVDALDARIRVLIEPSEDILKEYDGEAADTAEADELTTRLSGGSNAITLAAFPGAVGLGGGSVFVTAAQRYIPNQLPGITWPWEINDAVGMRATTYGNFFFSANWPEQEILKLRQALEEKERENTDFRAENARLRSQIVATQTEAAIDQLPFARRDRYIQERRMAA